MKGLHTMLSATLLLMIVVAISVVVFNWVANLSKDQSDNLRNSTTEQLGCQFADMYILSNSVQYNCSGSCAAGVSHNLTLAIRNNGKRALEFSKVSLRNTTGSVFSYSITPIIINSGEDATINSISNNTCTGINNTIDAVTITSVNCPGTAFDSFQGNEVRYVNC
jgi:hypothetical protein